jgi:polyhydroxybutyrate depolymerase
MTKKILVGLLVAAGVAGAEEADWKSAGNRDMTMTVGDRERTLRLHIPQKLKPSAPLVIALHGAMSDGPQTEAMTGFSKIADRDGFVAAYPNGTNRLWNYIGHGDDFLFIEALTDALVGAGTADRRRIYVTGISNGAYMSNRLAIECGDRIAAIAPVAGGFLRLGLNRQKPPRPVPVLSIHGTEDRIVGFDGTDFISRRDSSTSADELVDFWVKANGAKAEAEVRALDDENPEDGCTVERRVHAAGEGGAEVRFYKITGGGHTWPGMPADVEAVLGKTCRDFDASEVIWAWFRKQSLPEAGK